MKNQAVQHKQYFGTDGIRGRVGASLMNPEFVLKLGWAAGQVISQAGATTVLIGKDTRLSGYMFESALEAGFSAAGINIDLLGPMPTPAIAYLTRTLRAQAGLVISASHNPYHDNGIKFFSQEGTKFSDAMELAIEKKIQEPLKSVASAKMGKAKRIADAPGRYVEFCKNTIATHTVLSGLKIVVDCANGATYHIAPAVFRELGATVHVLNNQPNGTNINENCGTMHPEGLQQAVRDQQADIGIALDGDGDRVALVDHQGHLLDGDDVLFVVAKYRIAQGQLKTGVIGTVMSNLGLELAMEAMNIPFERTPVGDRYVSQALQSKGWLLGGEPSGHIIHFDKTTSGDGIIAALQILSVMHDTGNTLNALAQTLEKLPQTLVNVPLPGEAASAQQLLEDATLQKTAASLQKDLGKRGRILLRPSGTEPIIRIMVEGENPDQIHTTAQTIASLISKSN